MSKRSLDRRDIPRAFLAGARWLANPVSEQGAKQVPRIKVFAGGPEILHEVERMRSHPTGKRLLDERPDLGVALSNSAALKTMPVGSLGRTFYEAMEIPGGVPGYLLAALIYKDGFFDSLEMSEDTVYFLERSRWLHDLFHIVTGYGTDLPGEGLLIYFMLGYEHRLPYWAAALAPFGIGPRFFIRPSCGQRRWRALLRDAHARGLAANRVCPPAFVPWEEWLPRPVDEVRKELGIVPFLDDTSGWLDDSWFGRQAASGFGAYAHAAERAQLARKVVEAGVDYRDLYRASDAKAQELSRLAADGASAEEIRAAAAA
ncbi:MAG: Coq4 family protein [Proteobacteria bacterium]|nr:Coq4 family protein [Pseudomonadota bacterium]